MIGHRTTEKNFIAGSHLSGPYLNIWRDKSYACGVNEYFICSPFLYDFGITGHDKNAGC